MKITHLVLICLTIWNQEVVQQNEKILDKTKSRQLLKEAEKQIISAHKTSGSGTTCGLPLNEKYLTFRAKSEHWESDHLRYTLVATVNTSLASLVSIDDFFPSEINQIDQYKKRIKELEQKIRDDKADDRTIQKNNRVHVGYQREIDKLKREIGTIQQKCESTVNKARHELRISLPDDFQRPDRLPNHFDVIVLVKNVTCNGSKSPPSPIIHCDLVQSEQLGYAKNLNTKRPNEKQVNDQVESSWCFEVNLTPSLLFVNNCSDYKYDIQEIVLDGKIKKSYAPHQLMLAPDEEIQVQLAEFDNYSDYSPKGEIHVIEFITDVGHHSIKVGRTNDSLCRRYPTRQNGSE